MTEKKIEQCSIEDFILYTFISKEGFKKQQCFSSTLWLQLIYFNTTYTLKYKMHSPDKMNTYTK